MKAKNIKGETENESYKAKMISVIDWRREEMQKLAYGGRAGIAIGIGAKIEGCNQKRHQYLPPRHILSQDCTGH